MKYIVILVVAVVVTIMFYGLKYGDAKKMETVEKISKAIEGWKFILQHQLPLLFVSFIS